VTLARFAQRCAELEPGFSITENALAAETAWRLVYLRLLCALEVQP
jgi:hypothetical protein